MGQVPSASGSCLGLPEPACWGAHLLILAAAASSGRESGRPLGEAQRLPGGRVATSRLVWVRMLELARAGTGEERGSQPLPALHGELG